MVRLPWVKGSKLDVPSLVDQFANTPATAERRDFMRRLLHAIWAEAYTLGGIDISAGREPNERANPYGVEGGG